MSITFYVEPGTPTSYEVSCLCETSVSLVFSNYTGANSFLYNSPGHVLEGCTDEDGYCYQLFIDVKDDASELPDVNMSNSNASDVLETLGVDMREAGYAGSFEADDLLARINIGLAVAPESAERLTYTEGSVTMCGRPEGYVQGKLECLITIAEHAREMGRQVVWA